MKFAHAEHNESLCDHLLENLKWNDWVMTTAFYSALHYVEDRLFPLELDGDTYEDFDEYYLERQKHKDFSSNKHQSRINLIFRKLKYAHQAYKFLFEACYSARYQSYIVDEPTAKQAKIKLLVVKSYCNPPVTPKAST